jgi:CheY-like chemotaxis protein
MDIQMPDLNGIETIAYIRKYSAQTNIPIIALTALDLAGDRAKYLACGATAYLTKPIKLKDLHHNIQKLISK